MATVDMTSLKILVIDDEAFMRQLIVRVLKDLGAGGVHEAGNGSEALKQLTERSNDLDLVICDLEMPTMDGFEFVQELRAMADPALQKIPVLIVSGHSEEENIRKAVGLGISGFLVKPISGQALENCISDALLNPMIKPAKE